MVDVVHDFPLREKCPNTGKYGPEKTPYLDNFHAVFIFKSFPRY